MSAAQKKVIPVTDLQSQLRGTFAASIDVVDGSRHQGSVQSARTIVAAEGLEMAELLSWKLDREANHVCQIDAGSLQNELNTSALMMRSPGAFMDSPIETILGPAAIVTATKRSFTKLSLRFHKGSEKGVTLDKLRDLLTKQGRSDSLISDAVLVADEMFTNAIFNAPYVDLKSGFNPGIDRNDWSVEMTLGRHAELLVGYDESRLVIACRDPFGSLDIRQMLTRIRDCCTKGVSANMRMGVGGAGIGTFMVLNASSSLYVGVQPGKCSVIAAAIHWKWGTKKRSQTPKNLHCIQF